MFLLPALTAAAVLLYSWPMEAARDLRESIINGTEPCFHYTAGKNLLHMNCSVLYWQAAGYEEDTYISLGAHEIFDGDSTVDAKTESYIDLSGIDWFDGLFIVQDSVITFAEAPSIKNVHVSEGSQSVREELCNMVDSLFRGNKSIL